LPYAGVSDFCSYSARATTLIWRISY